MHVAGYRWKLLPPKGVSKTERTSPETHADFPIVRNSPESQTKPNPTAKECLQKVDFRGRSVKVVRAKSRSPERKDQQQQQRTSPRPCGFELSILGVCTVAVLPIKSMDSFDPSFVLRLRVGNHRMGSNQVARKT